MGEGFDYQGAAQGHLFGVMELLCYPDCGGGYTNLYVLRSELYTKKINLIILNDETIKMK